MISTLSLFARVHQIQGEIIGDLRLKSKILILSRGRIIVESRRNLQQNSVERPSLPHARVQGSCALRTNHARHCGFGCTMGRRGQGEVG